MTRNGTKAALIAIALLAEATIAAAQHGAAGPAGNDRGRLICRRLPETGSLAQTRRQCFTKAEWDRIAESQQEGARKTIEGLTTKPGGN